MQGPDWRHFTASRAATSLGVDTGSVAHALAE
jgi:hypothetical protein